MSSTINPRNALQLVLFGPPGAGKGTVAARLMKQFTDCPYIATGDYFRAIIRAGAPLAAIVEPYMSQGQLIPDDIVVGEIAAKFAAGELDTGFVFDGFPRTHVQAEALDRLLSERGLGPLQAVTYIDVPDEEVIARLSTRRVCDSCGAIYNVRTSPPATEGVCDQCGGPVVQRTDDVAETIKRRLTVYRGQTEAILTYYRNAGLLHRIDGTTGSDNVTAEITNFLASQA